jgi:hypothetical protein
VPKKSGGLAQVIEHLPSKGKDLSSNLSTEKKKKEGGKKIWSSELLFRE